MSKDLMLPQGGKLTKRQRELQGKLRGADNLVSSGGYGKRISIRGGVYRKIVDGHEVAKVEARTLNMVIIASSGINRTYYKTKFKEGEDLPPTCWSSDSKKPAPQVPEENRQCETCNDCPQNIKGSSDNDTRACRFSQRVAVMLEGKVEEGGEIYQLTVPSKSLFGSEQDDKGGLPLRAYAKVLRTAGPTPVEVSWVVTQARFDPDSTAPKLTFKAVRYLEEEEMEAILWAQDSDDVSKALEMDYSALVAPTESQDEDEDEDEAPPPKKKKRKPAPEPEEDEDEDEEEDEDEAPPLPRERSVSLHQSRKMMRTMSL